MGWIEDLEKLSSAIDPFVWTKQEQKEAEERAKAGLVKVQPGVTTPTAITASGVMQWVLVAVIMLIVFMVILFLLRR